MATKRNWTWKKSKENIITSIEKFKKEGITVLYSLSENELTEMLKLAIDNYYEAETTLLSDDEYDILREYVLDKYPTNIIAKEQHTQIKIDKNTEYDLLELSDKFKAPSIEYVKKIYLENDPKELYIPINELIYNLETKNIVETCYWYEWILNYEISQRQFWENVRQYAHLLAWS